MMQATQPLSVPQVVAGPPPWAAPADAEYAYHPSKSYGFVKTRELLDIFGESGWEVADTQQGFPRTPARRGFQAHLVRLRNPAYPSLEGLAGHQAARPELVVLNSHDKTTSFRMWWGLHRFACANGLIAGACLGEIRIHHNQRIVDRLGAGIAALMDRLPAMVASVNRLGRKRMTQSAVADFTGRAYACRLIDHGRLRLSNLTIAPTVPLRRPEDDAADVYTVLNRLQEVCIRGGIAYRGTAMVRQPGTEVRVARDVDRVTRRLASVGAQVSLNQKLYAMAEDYV